VQSDTKKRVGILRGGTGGYYKSSLQRGGDVIAHILEKLGDKYKPIDILIDKDYLWHVNGLPVVASDLMHQVDVVWNLTHPSFSNILTSLSIPNIGTSSFASSLENSRDMLREHIKKINLLMPRSIVLPVYQEDFDGPLDKYAIKKAKEVFNKFSSPWIVKSFTPDESMGIHLTQTFGELAQAIQDGVNHNKSILIEEFISGKPAAVHSILGFRGENVYVLLPENSSIEQAGFTTTEKEKIITLAKDLHQHLNAKNYLKTDFILHPRRGFFITNIEFIPDLRMGSHLEKSCESIGAQMHNVVEHILEGAI